MGICCFTACHCALAGLLHARNVMPTRRVFHVQVMVHVTEKEHRKVAVHCHAGLGRTG